MAEILPMNYKLHFEPNLETFVFKGTLDLTVSTSEPITELVLNTLEIVYSSISIDLGLGVEKLTYTEDQAKQELTISLPPNDKTEFTLHFEFTGEHNDKLAGFYRSKFKVGDKDEYCAVTQFQANDARRAFPCFDVPGIKATFDIEFLMNKEHFPISNMPIKEEVDMGVKKLVRFEQTPKMSSYLVFLAVGNFDFIEKTSKNIHYRLIASPGKPEKYGQFSLDFGVEVVEFCEDYFDYAYPLPKMDQIATPDFAAGAMENWGAILYRENALLYYPGITSESQTNRLLGVVSHEIIHQWFGNLVSPKTWKYLWLNESFATYFGNYVVDQLRPERDTFNFFVQSTNLTRTSGSTTGVMDWDSMISTSPIEMEGDKEVSFTAKTVPILYTKGGSILRQVHGYLGDEDFKKGLRHYFKTHAYTSTVSPQLWEALEEATGNPVSGVMESFVMQAGLPLVEVHKEGTVLKLKQKRFTYLPHDSTSKWMVPLTFRVFNNGEEEIRRFVLEEKEGSLDLGPHDAFKVNIDLTGFYRTKYDTSEYPMLGKLIAKKKITAIDRMHIEDDMYALLKAKEISLREYMEFTKYYKDETNYMPIFNIAVHLNEIYDLREDAEIKTYSKSFVEWALDIFGYEPKTGEELGISIIRGSMLRFAVSLGSEKAKAFTLDLYAKIKNGEAISADLRPVALVVGAHELNEFDFLLEKFNNPESESAFIEYITALGNLSDIFLLEKVKEMVFNEVPSRNRGFLITQLAANKKIKDDIWFWYIANLDGFEALNNFMYQGAILSVVSNSEKHRSDMKQFFDDMVKKKPRISDAVEVALEQLDITLNFKEYITN
ncbi:MAG: M1 family metallopeptidase [Candidatus Heimdallarchaeota archaeon]|nr:M1 family metallopeptidase [Candidatus Heimdallarchaeota archaeon]